MFSAPKDKAITGKARESLLAGIFFSLTLAEIGAFKVNLSAGKDFGNMSSLHI